MMTQTKLADLVKEGQKYAADARGIAEKADADPSAWNETTVAEFNEAMAKGKECAEKIKTARHDLFVLGQAKELAEEIGDVKMADDIEAQGGHPVRQRLKALGLTITDSVEYKSMMASYPGGRVPNGTHVQSAPIPVKSLVTGVAPTSAGAFTSPERTNIVEMLGRKTLTVRDLVTVRTTTSDVVEFIRQTGHTNNAAVVPEATSSAADATVVAGGYKPEGEWVFEVVPANVKTIAEWVPITKRALADVGQLEGLINDELALDVKEAEEAQILNGNGSGENFRGITATSGIQTQAWTTDIFITTRKAVTKARTVGRVVPTAWVFNPTDAEALDLATFNQGQYFYGGPQSLGPRTLWGYPVVESENMAAGTAILGDWAKAVIWDREQTTVTFSDSHADFFVRNLVAILAEERLAFGVTRPPAFVSVDVAA